MLGQNIRKLRLERGMNQEELGQRVWASKQSVSNWENDNIMPSVEVLVRLADCFGVSTDYLLGRSESRALDTSGLSDRQLAHLQMIIDDLRAAQKEMTRSLDLP